MIPRYQVPEVSALWSEEARFSFMLKVEVALLRALEHKGLIPAKTAEAFRDVEIRPERIREIEATTRHDVIAFCSSITEQVPPGPGRFFHFGVTSSDVLDTALSLQLRESLRLISRDLRGLLDALEGKIAETKDLLCLGRSHGMSAEPMIFAQKFLSSHQELQRRLTDYERALGREITGQFSGAVGNYTLLDPETEAWALEELDLPVEPVSSQVIPRDHLAKIVSIGALVGAALERLAVELRLLHHSDVGEVSEGFKPGQKGSSTMPHKRNPVSAENISGLSRILRSHATIAFENCVLWHERDISHSSAERLYLPDHFGLLCYTLRRMTATIEQLEVHRGRIEEKVEGSFTSLSSLVLHALVLRNKVPREELYAFVQELTFSVKSLDEFFTTLRARAQERAYDLPPQIDREWLGRHYQENFKKVLKRCGL